MGFLPLFSIHFNNLESVQGLLILFTSTSVLLLNTFVPCFVILLLTYSLSLFASPSLIIPCVLSQVRWLIVGWRDCVVSRVLALHVIGPGSICSAPKSPRPHQKQGLLINTEPGVSPEYFLKPKRNILIDPSKSCLLKNMAMTNSRKRERSYGV